MFLFKPKLILQKKLFNNLHFLHNKNARVVYIMRNPDPYFTFQFLNQIYLNKRNFSFPTIFIFIHLTSNKKVYLFVIQNKNKKEILFISTVDIFSNIITRKFVKLIRSFQL